MAKARSSDFRIPKFNVQQLVIACSETMDWSLKEFGISDLWKYTTGKGVKVAVLDTGCAVMHPDLKEQIADAADFTGSRVGPGDTNGHGTHCCGIIAAKKNDVGIVGVAHGAKLLVGKVLNDAGVGSVAGIVKGIEWAVEKKADIISMSFGSASSDPRIKRAIEYAASKNVLLVAAAGNEGPGPQTVGYPGRYPQVLSVAAIDPARKIAKFSSRGPEVDVAAPGVDILSTYPPRNYAKLSGTSMATPFVSAVVALLLSYDRQKGLKRVTNYESLIKQVKDTSIEAGVAGFDSDYGWGLINPKGLILGEASGIKKINLHKPKAKVERLSFGVTDCTPEGAKKFKQIFGEAAAIELVFESKKSGKNA